MRALQFSDIPIEVKNSASSSISNGSMSAWSLWRNDESARRTPARKAPSDAESPISVIKSETPATVKSEAAIIASRTWVNART